MHVVICTTYIHIYKFHHNRLYQSTNMESNSHSHTKKATSKSLLIFWLSSLSIALLSIFLAHLLLPSPMSAITTPFTSTCIEQVLRIWFPSDHDEGVIGGIISLIKGVNRRSSHHRRHGHHHHHHRRPKPRCDGSKWTALIASININATTILTVDHNGCGKFSSVQDAVDAVPDDSPHRSLILIDTGVYR